MTSILGIYYLVEIEEISSTVIFHLELLKREKLSIFIKEILNI